MTPTQILDLDELERRLAGPGFLLFKHSLRCGTSDRAFQQYSRFLAAHEDIPTGWIDVVAQRDWSDRVAREAHVMHESPQAIWFRNGSATWHASHWDITVDSLTEAVNS